MLSIDDFGTLFENLEHSAWRLLTLDNYDVLENERADFAEWQRTGRVRDRAGEPWLDMVTHYARHGVPFARTHLFPGRDQLTPYCAYVLETYEANDAAGESVNIADKASHPELARLDTDFWLLDDKVIVLEYDDKRHYAGAYAVTGTMARQLREQRELASRYAVPLASYKADRRRQLLA